MNEGNVKSGEATVLLFGEEMDYGDLVLMFRSMGWGLIRAKLMARKLFDDLEG